MAAMLRARPESKESIEHVLSAAHLRDGGDPDFVGLALARWIPAFAGMSGCRVRAGRRLSIRRWWARRASRFAADERGNVAILFALASVVLVGIAGAAIDYANLASIRA